MQKMHSSAFSFVPVVARSAVCRCFPTFGGFEANKASEGEHLVQTLPARKHCQPKIISSKKIIASEKTLPAKNHCRQKIIASKKNYCQQKLLPTKTLPAKNISSKKTLPEKTLPAENHCQQILNSAFEKNGLLAQNPWNMGEQKWPILPAMETHKKCKNAAKATFALQQSFCPTIFIEIVYRSPTKDKPCQPMSSFKNKLASSQIKLEKLLNICVLSKI